MADQDDVTIREKRLVQGVVEGKTVKDAALQAGYAASTANSDVYAIIRRPRVQSFLTQALEDAGLTPARIIKPLVDGLEACHVVKSAEQLAVVGTTVPDISTRMEAANRIIELYGQKPREIEMPAPVVAPMTVIIARASDRPSRSAPPVLPPDSPAPAAASDAGSPSIDVTFSRQKPEGT